MQRDTSDVGAAVRPSAIMDTAAGSLGYTILNQHLWSSYSILILTMVYDSAKSPKDDLARHITSMISTRVNKSRRWPVAPISHLLFYELIVSEGLFMISSRSR